MLDYNSRTWLNNEDSSFTGSIVCCSTYEHNDKDDNGTIIPYQFVEISDCHCKIRIHSNFRNSDKKVFITKLKTMKNEIDKFIQHLESV